VRPNAPSLVLRLSTHHILRQEPHDAGGGGLSQVIPRALPYDHRQNEVLVLALYHINKLCAGVYERVKWDSLLPCTQQTLAVSLPPLKSMIICNRVAGAKPQIQRPTSPLCVRFMRSHQPCSEQHQLVFVHRSLLPWLP